MKRPIRLYLVTVWLCFGMLMQCQRILALGREYQEAGQPTPPYIPGFGLLALVLAGWLAVGLLRLRAVARWLAIAFLAYWVIFGSWAVARIALSPEAPKNATAVVVVIVIWLLGIVPGIASIIYLSGKRFREFAAKYAEEKDREAMQAYCEKKLKTGL